MKKKTNQSIRNLIINFLNLFLGFIWIYISRTKTFVNSSTNLLFLLIGVVLIINSVLRIKDYYFKKIIRE